MRLLFRPSERSRQYNSGTCAILQEDNAAVVTTEAVASDCCSTRKRWTGYLLDGSAQQCRRRNHLAPARNTSLALGERDTAQRDFRHCFRLTCRRARKHLFRLDIFLQRMYRCWMTDTETARRLPRYSATSVSSSGSRAWNCRLQVKRAEFFRGHFNASILEGNYGTRWQMWGNCKVWSFNFHFLCH